MHKLTLRFISLMLVLAAASVWSNCYSQGIGIGGSVIRNWQTEGTGFGFRAAIPVREKVTVIPQFTWFPSFNILNEYFGGVSVHYDVLERSRFTAYVSGSGHINVWVNASESSFSKAKTMNVSPDIGAGLLFGHGCWKPFLEHNYNPVWKEGSTHLGILWYPQCSFSGGKGKGRSRTGSGSHKSRDRCPAYH